MPGTLISVSIAPIRTPQPEDEMAQSEPSASQVLARKMTHYMAWANAGLLDTVAQLPDGEIMKPRQTLFSNMAHTMNHIFVIGDIFRAHLEGRAHGYAGRNTETSPPFAEVSEKLKEIDRHYVASAAGLSDAALHETVHFSYVGGGDGAMTRLEILLHLVNHASFHRGFVNDMLFQVPSRGKAFDLTVFLRDAWPGIHNGA
jgi:uncharacterized damage-inducible protein DinB